jgi:hypothetical protein
MITDEIDAGASPLLVGHETFSITFVKPSLWQDANIENS